MRATVADAVRTAGLPTSLPSGTNLASIVSETHGDKKARGGVGRYALPEAIGAMPAWNGRWSVAVPDDIVQQALDEHQTNVA